VRFSRLRSCLYTTRQCWSPTSVSNLLPSNVRPSRRLGDSTCTPSRDSYVSLAIAGAVIILAWWLRSFRGPDLPVSEHEAGGGVDLK
jgi:hypothetical protein